MAEIKRILVSQPKPAILEKSPFFELANKHNLEVDYRPLIEVKGVTPKEFRSQRVEILAHTAVIFTSRTTIDSFFRICEDARITVPETLKYICSTEAIALYLQKYIVYRKRKISFADGSFTGIIEQVVKHKDEKLLLALSEPHKPEIPEALTRLKVSINSYFSVLCYIKEPVTHHTQHTYTHTHTFYNSLGYVSNRRYRIRIMKAGERKI